MFFFFFGVKMFAEFGVLSLLPEQLRSVIASHLNSDFSTVNRIADIGLEIQRLETNFSLE